MKEVLVTGGAGFVGSHIAARIKIELPGVNVAVFDNLHRAGCELNLGRLRKAGISFVHGDLRNQEDFKQLKPAELIVECSAEPSVMAGYRGTSPEYLLNTNLFGTANCLEWGRLHRANFIFLSTSRVYPIVKLNSARFVEENSRFRWTDNQDLPGISASGVTEVFPMEGARSLYGMTKLASEMLLEEYRYAYGIGVTVNRCGLLAGPWQMGKVDQGVVTYWVIQHLLGNRLEYIGFGGNGKQVRDFLHIDDLVELVLHQIRNFQRFDGQTYNVGGGEQFSLSLTELTTLCRELCKSKVPITANPDMRQADIRIYISDCNKLFSVCDWRPKRTATETIEDITRWATDNLDVLRGILQ